MHDVTYSLSSTIEPPIEVPMPPDEPDFELNTTFEVPRTAASPGTGTTRSNPRENVNQATTWLDLSSLYGSTKVVALALRSFKDGKLFAQRSVGPDHLGDYLPFNTMNVTVNSRPGQSPEDLYSRAAIREPTKTGFLLPSIRSCSENITVFAISLQRNIRNTTMSSCIRRFG